VWWTKTTAGFRVWFVVRTGAGALRTGLVAGNFAVTVVNPADSATSTPAVSESTQLAGLYTFLVPAAFLVANGVGEYGLAIRVTLAPLDAVGAVLRVSLADLDDLATAAALALVQADTDDIQTRLPATLVGGRMRSHVEAMDAGTITAAAVATDAIDADALAADAVAEIQFGLATAAALAFVQADTDDIQTRLPASLNAGRMRSHVEAMDAGVVTAAVIATDAIDADALAADAVAEVADGVWDEPIAGHLAVGSTGEALAAAAAGGSPATIADAVWDEARVGHVGAGSFGETVRVTPAGAPNLDAAVSSRAAPGDAMDLVAGAVDAAAIATDAIDSDAIAASAVAEIQAGLATAATLAAVGAAVLAVNADTDDIQTRLPATLVGGRMRSQVEGMDSDVIGAAQIAAGAITASEAPALVNLDATVSSRAVPGDAMTLTPAERTAVAGKVWDEALPGAHAAGTAGERLATTDDRVDATVSSRAAPGDAMDLVADAVDVGSLAASAIGEIADGVWDEPLAGHLSAGSTGEALDIGTQDEAQLNVAYDTAATTIYCEAWLDRGGRSVPAANLVSVTVTIFDKDGTIVTTLTAADAIPTPGSPQANGRYNLEKSGIVLANNRPYNITVTVTDTIGAVTTFQAFSTVG